MDSVGRVIRIFLATRTHYKVDFRKLREMNSPAFRQEQMRMEGGYNKWRVELVPIRDIRVPKVWNPGRFDQAKKLIDKGTPLDPIRATKVGGKWEIDDGIHRTNVSIAKGYTHVPVLVPEWVATPEAYEAPEPEKKQLTKGTWIKLREPFDGRSVGWVDEQLGSNQPRGVRRWRYGLALIGPGEDWPDTGDFSDDELDVRSPPPWAIEARLKAEAAGWA